MTPVGLIAVLLALAAGYQTITRGPAFLMAGIALATYVAIRTVAVRTGRSILAGRAAAIANTDPWRRPSRRDQRLQARSLALCIALTELTSLFPSMAAHGSGICDRLGYA